MNRKTMLNVFGLIVCSMMLSCSLIPMAGAATLTVQTDKSSYSRGETVTVSVSGGTASGVVMIQFNNRNGDAVWAVQDNFNSGGSFQCQVKIPSNWLTGTYTLILKDLSAGVVRTKTFEIPGPAPPPPNQKPVANGGPDQTAFVGRTVYFDGSGSRDPDGSIVSYSWSFGDGTSASGRRVSHVYTSAGTYTAKLTVMDNRGDSDSDTCIVTVKTLPRPPSAGVEEGVLGNAKDYVVDAMEEVNTTVTINTTDPVTVFIFAYDENPHPDVPLPENTIPVVVDIAVSSPDAVVWPIHVERHYTDRDIARWGLDESRLGIYYYKDGAWHRCRDTGVYTDVNIVWANMYRDEVTGSPIVIGEVPAAAAFEVYDLSISPSTVDVGVDVTISIEVKNVGEMSGSHTVTLKVRGAAVGSETVALDGGASTTVSFTVSEDAAGTYSVEVDGLSGSFTVAAPPTPPAPAEFEVSDLSVTPSEVEPGEAVTVSAKVSNVGEASGSYTVEVKLDGVAVDSKTVTLSGGASQALSFTVSSEVVGSHTVGVDGLTGRSTVAAPPAPPTPLPWTWIGLIVVIIVVVILYFFLRRGA